MLDNTSRIVLTGEHTLPTAIAKLLQIFKPLELCDFCDETMVLFKNRTEN